MRRQIALIVMTLAALALIDIAVAGALSLPQAPASLVRYFDYGRSVPGKLREWIAAPDAPGNLFEVGWRDAEMTESAALFAAEDPAVPVARSYGMSFVNQIMRPAHDLAPDLPVDLHGGPSAPPNFTYALFREDRPNRRPGDVVVLGVLSSSIAAMASLSNQTWNFEQPAPFTYPVYRPGDGPDAVGGLVAVEPLVRGAADQRRALSDPAFGARWDAQLAAEDAMRSSAAYALPALDRAPFARLARRSLATDAVRRAEAAALAPGGFPWAETLRRMIVDFVRTARADGQIPVVVLVQGRDRGDPDLKEAAAPAIAAERAPLLATVDVVDPRDLNNFQGDGHYTPASSALFARAFLDILAREGVAAAREAPRG